MIARSVHPTRRERLQARSIGIGDLDLVCYDFDGVMTDNRVLVSEDGIESVLVNRADGWAVSRLKEAGVQQVVVSTERNRVVAARARKLGIECLQGIEDKAKALQAFARKRGLSLARAAFIGNDVNDLEVMELVGLRVAPSDANPRVLAVADHVTCLGGGHGVIREFYEMLVEKEENDARAHRRRNRHQP